MFSSSELVFQINTHLLYEVKWMIFAATEYQRGDTRHYMALIDSACMHARNLLEFVSKNGEKNFTLKTLGGTVAVRKDWTDYLNTRMSHMYGRERIRLSWPDGISNDSDDKLVAMANTVLDLLETNGQSISNTDIRDAYDKLLQAARGCLIDPSEENFATLSALYDNSQDGRTY